MAEEPFFVHTLHKTYLSIALDSYLKASNLEKKVDRMNFDNLHEFSKILSISSQIGECRVISIIFSALCLEAFINHYAINKFPRPFFDKYLEKLPIKTKWILIPRLVTGDSFGMGSKPIAELKKLFNLRDKLVHFKTCVYDTVEEYVQKEKKDEIISEQNTKTSLLSVASIIKALRKIDTNVDDDWIKKALEALALRE